MLLNLIHMFKHTPLKDFPKKYPIFVGGIGILIFGILLSFLFPFWGSIIGVIGILMVIYNTYFQ
jgi:hypothetical protein